jgi:hypothetical protein
MTDAQPVTIQHLCKLDKFSKIKSTFEFYFLLFISLLFYFSIQPWICQIVFILVVVVRERSHFFQFFHHFRGEFHCGRLNHWRRNLANYFNPNVVNPHIQQIRHDINYFHFVFICFRCLTSIQVTVLITRCKCERNERKKHK